MEASGYDFSVLPAHKPRVLYWYMILNVIMFTLVSSDFQLSQE